MPKYIDFDALGVQSCNPDVFLYKAYAQGWNSLMRILYDAPAADVEPKRKTGHWIKDGDDVMCSVCDEILCGEAWEDLDPIDDIGLHYCPNCGSRMLHEPPKEEVKDYPPYLDYPIKPKEKDDG